MVDTLFTNENPAYTPEDKNALSESAQKNFQDFTFVNPAIHNK